MQIGLGIVVMLLVLLVPAGAAAQAPALDPALCMSATFGSLAQVPADWEQRVHPSVRPIVEAQRIIGRHGLIVGWGGTDPRFFGVTYWDGTDLYRLGLPRTYEGSPLYVQTAPDIPRAAVGGAPPPRLPLPKDGCPGALDARIQVVWPRDVSGREAPAETAPLVNVEAYLYERGTRDPVPCDLSNPVRLRWAEHDLGPRPEGARARLEPAHEGRSVLGRRVIREADGKRFPAWVFDDVPVRASTTYFFVDVDGAHARTNVWAHGAQPSEPAPSAPSPIRHVEPPTPPIDARIALVWPHDGRGNPMPLGRATHANVGVDLLLHQSDGPLGVTSVGRQRITLLRALDDGYLEPARQPDGNWAKPWVNEVPGTGLARIEFGGIDVAAARDPGSRYYFAVQVDAVEMHTTIWAYGADARTHFPVPDVPARSGDGCG